MTEAGRYHTASKTSIVPLYYQVELDMRRRIEAGLWQPGQQIPSEKELCELYDVSRITLRQAIGALVDEGLIVRARGRGSFVRDSIITAGARGLTSFTDEMVAKGWHAGARLLSLTSVPAPDDIADRLRIEPGESLVVCKRVRLANDTPIGIQTAHLPAARFPGLAHAALGNGSLYAYLEAHYGVAPVEAHEILSVGTAPAADAELLGVPVNSSSLFVERLTFDHRQEPFEFVTSIMRGDRYRVQLVLRSSRREL